MQMLNVSLATFNEIRALLKNSGTEGAADNLKAREVEEPNGLDIIIKLDGLAIKPNDAAMRKQLMLEKRAA